MIIDRIRDVAREAGNIMLSARRPKIMEKGGHANFFTETDEKIQAFLMEKLKEVLPGAFFVCEEDGYDQFSAGMGQGFCFVIDPLDGTSNFIYGYRPSVVSIGLLKDGRPYIGVIYDPFDDLLFSAGSGQGAFMNGERIMSSDAPLAESLAIFGTAAYYDEMLDKTFDAAKRLLPLCVDIRRSGSAAWDICCVASGKCGLFFEMKLQLWDFAAGAVIAEEAGCTITDIDGQPIAYTGPSSVLCISKGVRDTGYTDFIH